ncbi:MAG: response regulator, partial [Clostridium sp.]|nr:response regulator [Clostridium sp.]
MSQKMINLIFAVLLVIVGAYFLLGELLLPSDKLDNYSVCTEYSGEWKRILPDGTTDAVTMPGKCVAGRNETVVVETELPDNIANGRYLCFRSAKQDMRFFIDGQLRNEYSTKESRLFGRMSAAAYVFLEMNEEDAGKVLRVELCTDSSYSGVFYTVYYGTPMGVWKYFFKQFGLELIVAFVTLMLSIVAIIASVALRFCYHRKVPLEYLGWGILVAAVWLITNSSFRQLIFPNLSIVNDITFIMIMLLSLPYLLYMNEVQKGHYKWAYQILEGIVIVNFFVCSALHMTGICDFTDTISYISAFCIISIILLIVTILLDIRSGLIREYRFVAVGMSGVCVAAFIQIIFYFHKSNLFNGMILALGLIFLLIFSTISTIYEIMGMEREKQQAMQASESKGRFLANMSHEIRTPIHAVLGMDAMILRESSEARIREYALDIQNAGQTLLSLINDILDLSKIESGKLEILPAEYDLSSLIHDVVNMLKMKAKDKGLSLELSVNESLPSGLWGDDVRIRQILVNLMTNAVKYTESGSVTLTVDGVVHPNSVSLTFRVADTGVGIREEDIEKLYREFERIEEQRNRAIEGTGLGINIVTQLLEKMGSRLQVESEYGKGSVFSFVLEQEIRNPEPVGDLEQRIRNQAEAYTYQAMFAAPEAHILVVDDNAVNRRVFVKLLEATQVQIDEAGGGKECLELVQKNTYDLIFLDHMMPDMDGIAVLHEMKKRGNLDAPVIALTANAVTGAKEMYLKEGFRDFLSKPVNPEKLEKMIMRFLPQDKLMDGQAVPAASRKQAGTAVEETPLPELEGLDWNYAQLYLKDKTILMDTVNHFYRTAEEEAAQLGQFFEVICKAEMADEERLAQYRIKVHSMKNSAAMIGAVSLSGVAKMLEYAARDGKVDVIKNLTPLFLQEWAHMKEILEPVSES